MDAILPKKRTLFLKLLILTSFVQIVLIFIHSTFPVVLLFGPLFYKAVGYGKSNRDTLIHFLPVALCVLIWLVMNNITDSGQKSMRIVTIIESLISIGGYVSILRYRRVIHKIEGRGFPVLYMLIRQLSHFLLITGIVLLLFEVGWIGSPGFNLYFLVIAILLYGIFAAAHYCISFREEPALQDEEGDLPPVAFESNKYTAVLDLAMKEKQLFLKSNLTLEELAEELDTPKAHLSKILNQYIHKKFYDFVADYRIEYAIGLMKEIHLSLEGIAKESGFNSISSFNKHFKRVTGSTPSEYRENLLICL